MSEEKPEVVQSTLVRTTVSLPSTKGAMTITTTEEGVIVRLPCDAVLVSWSDWEFICRVYGKKKRS